MTMNVIRMEPAGLASAATLVCSWCRTVIAGTPSGSRKGDAENYGMCRSCLSHNLQRLEALDRGARGDRGSASREGRHRRVS